MKRTRYSIKKMISATIGFPLVVLGIILIPLPGPGLLTSLLGLFVLSYEFDWAKTRKEQTLKELHKIIQRAQMRADRIANYQKDNKSS